jgi:hypothetical protein
LLLEVVVHHKAGGVELDRALFLAFAAPTDTATVAAGHAGVVAESRTLDLNNGGKTSENITED